MSHTLMSDTSQNLRKQSKEDCVPPIFQKEKTYLSLNTSFKIFVIYSCAILLFQWRLEYTDCFPSKGL